MDWALKYQTKRPDIKYPGVMPSGYANNLAKLPKDQMDSIHEDSARWLAAYNLLRNVKGAMIKAWIEELTDVDYREDMRRRLNTRRGNIAKERGGRRG